MDANIQESVREALRAKERQIYALNRATVAARRAARNAADPSIKARAFQRYNAKLKLRNADQIVAKAVVTEERRTAKVIALESELAARVARKDEREAKRAAKRKAREVIRQVHRDAREQATIDRKVLQALRRDQSLPKPTEIEGVPVASFTKEQSKIYDQWQYDCHKVQKAARQKELYKEHPGYKGCSPEKMA